MSNVDKLLAKGAQIVGGDLIFKHKVMGMFRHDDFILTPEGEEELSITDVEVKEVPRKPRAKRVDEQITDSVTQAVGDVNIEV